MITLDKFMGLNMPLMGFLDEEDIKNFTVASQSLTALILLKTE